MGTWGSGPFENDSALDWAGDLNDADDLTLAMDALERVRGSDYVDADDASVAIAAAEVVAAVGGRPHADLPEDVQRWIVSSGVTLDPEHSEEAAAAVERIRGEDSELADLWAASGAEEWYGHLDGLTERLGR